MARAISDEELQLKKRARRRLVGALVLVTAVAVILPMVLDSEPKSVSQNVDIQIPSPDSGEFKPKAAAPAANLQSTPIKGMPPAPATPTKDAPAKSGGVAAMDTPAKSGGGTDDAKALIAEGSGDAAKAPAKEPAKAAAKDAPKAAAKEAAAGAYVVQVAALADVARVKALQKQMSAVGVKTYTEAVSTKGGEVTRVRAGPYATREAAETARTQLKKAGLEGKVVPK